MFLQEKIDSWNSSKDPSLRLIIVGLPLSRIRHVYTWNLDFLGREVFREDESEWLPLIHDSELQALRVMIHSMIRPGVTLLSRTSDTGNV